MNNHLISPVSLILYKKIFSILFFLLYISQPTFAQELPNPTPNLETIKAGSYVIAMDIANQGISKTSLSGQTYQGFNMKTYGLVYELLEKGVRLKWAIKSGKQKDAVDFSANAVQAFPSNGTAQDYDFVAGAFIIDLNNNITTSSCGDGNQGSNFEETIKNIIQNFGKNVKVYRLTNDEIIDIRYSLRIPPKIAVLNDGGYTEAVQDIFGLANIPSRRISNKDFLESAECNTFVAQPHIEPNEVDAKYIATIENFVNGGGNFLAQCIGIIAFENKGFFQSTNGFEYVETERYNSGHIYNTATTDLPLMQFDGDFSDEMYGTVASYRLGNNSNWNSSSYPAITLSNSNNRNFIASGTDINGATTGGNIYYCGGHEYSVSFLRDDEDLHSTPAFAMGVTNAQRLILNAAFIPANINFACAGADVCLCKDESVTLGCESNANITYTWSPADGLSCTDCPNPVASPTKTTTYTITPSTGDCGSESVTVTVLQNAEKPSIGNLQELCGPDKLKFVVSFEVNGNDPNGYVVTGSEGDLVDGIFTSDSMAINTSYSFLVSNSNGCSELIEGFYDCSCRVTASISGDAILCEDSIGVANLTVDLTGSENDDWTFVYAIDGAPQSSITTDQTPYVITTDTEGIYTIESVTGSPCNLSTVSGTARVQLKDCSPPCEAFFPTAFSPNNDGQNEIFQPIFNNCSINRYNFSIYNRWGKKVFESLDATEFWEGNNDELTIDLGVYFWVLSYETVEDGESITKYQQGNVVLLR